MAKYLIINPENDEEYIINSREGAEVALSLALGDDPEKYGVDAFESFFLINHVRDCAVKEGPAKLIASCEEALRKLWPDIELLTIQLSKNKEAPSA